MNVNANTIEDRLRAAYQDAAATVSPDHIRPLGGQPVMVARPAGTGGRPRPRRVLIPLTAAAAVAVLIVTATVVVPRVLAGQGRQSAPLADGPAGSPAGRLLVAISGTGGRTLTVRDALSGASVASIAAPAPGLHFSGLATGDGRHYVAALWRTGVCRTWLYQFQLSATGRPGRLVPYRLAVISQLLGPIAVSGDNSTFAYLGERCQARGSAPPASDLAAVHLATMRTSHWDIPKQADVGSLGLTTDGTLLGYDIEQTKLFPSAAYLLPTSAAPGTAAQRSRTVARGAQFGRRAEIISAVLTPDGAAMYLSTGSASGNTWQLRAADLATGRMRVVGRYAGFPQYLAAGPSGVRALAVVTLMPAPVPSSGGTPVPNPSSSNSATPVPVPGHAPDHASASGPAVTGPPVQLELVTLATGAVRQVRARWDPADTIFAW